MQRPDKHGLKKVRENGQIKSKIILFFPVKTEIPKFSKMEISLTEISRQQQYSLLISKNAKKTTQKHVIF